MSATYQERVELAVSYLEEIGPFMAAAPVTDLRPEDLASDKILNGEFGTVPFGGPQESGWTVWFFPRQVLRDTFVRRYSRARPLKYLTTVTGKQE